MSSTGVAVIETMRLQMDRSAKEMFHHALATYDNNQKELARKYLKAAATLGHKQAAFHLTVAESYGGELINLKDIDLLEKNTRKRQHEELRQEQPTSTRKTKR